MAKAAGQIEYTDFGLDMTSAGNDYARLYFMLPIHLQPKIMSVWNIDKFWQRFQPAHQLEIDNAGTTIYATWQLGNLISVSFSDTGVIGTADWTASSKSKGITSVVNPVMAYGLPPVDSMPAYVEGILHLKRAGTVATAKLFGIWMRTIHNIEYSSSDTTEGFRIDKSAHDAYNYNQPCSAFLLKKVLVETYNAMINKAKTEWSWMLWGDCT